ncbi:MAG: methyltransferase domain-containing protein [Anaerolineales bacterium]|nr:MAG: methyltransferase domain-containing protein [Anaerolineales bacterium]
MLRQGTLRRSGKKTVSIHNPQIQYENLFASKPYSRGKTPSLFALEALQVTSGQTALELGCGEGQDAIAFAQNGFTVKALDASSTAISHAQVLADVQNVTINWVCGNVLTLHLWEGLYDFIFTDGFLHFFDDDTLTGIVKRMQASTQASGINAIGVFDMRTSEIERNELAQWGIRCDSASIIEDLYATWKVLKMEQLISEREHGEIRGITHWVFKNSEYA